MKDPAAAREEILARLRAGSAQDIRSCQRPVVPPLEALSWDGEQLIEQFAERLSLQTGVVHRVDGLAQCLEVLLEIASSEGLGTVMAATDEVVAPLRLAQWGKRHGIEVLVASDFADREAFKDAVFDRAQAGITGADFAVAESGTLGLIHGKDSPRLISLAPVNHIALVPVQRIVPAYESATERVFGDRQDAPSHFTFITGPSMTADIKATPFRGMHGPQKLFVILIGGFDCSPSGP